MLEIILMVFIYRKLADKAQAKGHGRGWGALGPVLWIAGEIIGFVMGAAADMGMGAIIPALICAAAGAGIAFIIVGRLEHREGYYGFGEGYDATGLGTYDPANPYSPPNTYAG